MPWERFPTKKKIRPINRDREMFGHIERIGTTKDHNPKGAC